MMLRFGALPKVPDGVHFARCRLEIARLCTLDAIFHVDAAKIGQPPRSDVDERIPSGLVKAYPSIAFARAQTPCIVLVGHDEEKQMERSEWHEGEFARGLAAESRCFPPHGSAELPSATRIRTGSAEARGDAS